MKKLILFGNGDIADLAHYYFSNDSEYEVIAFTVDKAYILESEKFGLPVVPFEELEQTYDPNFHVLFVAVSYADMNQLRRKVIDKVKLKGYKLASYISSKCSYQSQFQPGENAFILEDNTIQPFVKIEDNVFLWSGNHIGHHSTIKSDNFISSHVVISGHCVIESNCFLGVNSTLAHKITLAKFTLLGAGAIISKNTEEKGVYVGARSTKIDKISTDLKL